MDLENTLIELVKRTNFSLGKDILGLLRKALTKEKDAKTIRALKVILENAKLAREKNIAICQDTGIPLVFLEVGRETEFTYETLKKIKNSIIKGYKKWGLRASSISPFNERVNYCPIIHIEFSRRKETKLTLLSKGFGSENKSKLRMFNPTATCEEIDEFIIESVKAAGPEACPPFIIGVGIGGTADTALNLAKKALLGKLDRDNPDKFLAKWEKRLEEKINHLKIGTMGWGGRITCLKVRIKTSFTHIAGLPVGINISCHALRRTSIILKNL